MKSDKINFDGMSIGNVIKKCLACETLEDAEIILYQYEDYCDTPEIARRNLGYIFGYCNPEDREKLYRLFPVNHPIFGVVFGRGNEQNGSEDKRTKD